MYKIVDVIVWGICNFVGKIVKIVGGWFGKCLIYWCDIFMD